MPSSPLAPCLFHLVLPGILHHVTQRGNGRQRAFTKDADYVPYLVLLADAAECDCAGTLLNFPMPPCPTPQSPVILHAALCIVVPPTPGAPAEFVQ